MERLLRDSALTQKLAGDKLDALAKERAARLKKKGASDSEAYRRGLDKTRQENPSLKRAADFGLIGATDFALLKLLLGNMKEHRESDTPRCSRCGENLALCRAKKLKRQRNIDDDSVAAMSQCVLDAQRCGDALDVIACYF